MLDPYRKGKQCAEARGGNWIGSNSLGVLRKEERFACDRRGTNGTWYLGMGRHLFAGGEILQGRGEEVQKAKRRNKNDPCSRLTRENPASTQPRTRVAKQGEAMERIKEEKGGGLYQIEYRKTVKKRNHTSVKRWPKTGSIDP